VLTVLLNDLATIRDTFVLVLDDYHVLDAPPIDRAITFLLEHLPPPMHLVIATREDPPLPLARLRARGHLTELRAADVRFLPDEAAAFLTQAMGLDLAAESVAALEARTEGWIAGLQLAALSLHGQHDTTRFLAAFTGNHQFILDYLVEEVLHQQAAHVQTFLLHTAILNRLCGPLCDAVLETPAGAGQTTLAYLNRANLFLIPLDSERRWYRYHHLFAELLRQRAQQTGIDTATLHTRASIWYEAHGLEVEAFQHAAAANDIARATRLVQGAGMPLHFRGAAAPVVHWLETLPAAVLDANPTLWVLYASVLSFVGQNTRVEPKLQAAEAALAGADPDATTRDLLGQIATIRAITAAPSYDVATILAYASRALDYLHPANLSMRTAAHWARSMAYQFQGDRVAARQAYTDTIAMSEASGNRFITILATTSLGILEETDNQLQQAAQRYRHVLHLVGEPPQPPACEAYLGLARLAYEWDDLDAAAHYGQQSIVLGQQIDGIDTPLAGAVLLARLKLAQGDATGAAALLTNAEQEARQQSFVQQLAAIAAVQVRMLLRQGNRAAAARQAHAHALPRSQARVHLAQGDPAAALAVLEPARQQAEVRGWHDDRLRVLVLQAVVLQAQGDRDEALQVLMDALALAAPAGFIRLFVDEGPPMVQLLTAAAAHGVQPAYTARLLAACGAPDTPRPALGAPPLVEPLSEREREILRLVAQGCSNREIGERLSLALDTVKGHNRRIFGKLGVQRRTEAVARARDLGLL
jgi:LuxR family maltose regulon positive regulatory protein